MKKFHLNKIGLKKLELEKIYFDRQIVKKQHYYYLII